MHRCDAPAAMVPLAIPLGASTFRALDPSVQGQREPRQRPLKPWPRHLLPSTPFSAARDKPFLRWKRDRTLSGAFPFSSTENRWIGAIGIGRGEDEEEDEE